MQFETLTYGYGLLEGPRIDKQNRLYFSSTAGGVFAGAMRPSQITAS